MIVCYWFGRRRPAFWLAATFLVLLAGTAPGAALEVRAAPDNGFAARHPRLFFSSNELPSRRARVLDGGADDDAYAFIRSQCYDVYASSPLDSLVRETGALEATLNLALVSHFEAVVDSGLVNLGRSLTLHIARTTGITNDPFMSSLYLRSLVIGFDHFFVNASAAERDEIRGEVQSYLVYMTTNLNYDIWLHRPYVSNKTAMVASVLGMAGICFQDELAPDVTAAAIARADQLYQAWRDTHLANDGCYREGSLYCGWSMRNLIYYFAARKRFDGVDFGADPVIRAIERWVPYELDPRGPGRVNNIQDQTDYYRPLARHTTYWAWAQSEWQSGLAAYMWEHSAGPLGVDMHDDNDKASTVLWHTGVPPINPGSVLERSRVWEDRGLYYFRTGWGDGAPPDDVVFSFYSGEFRGGHAQEDQNQFTLAAYGEKLVFDQGAGPQAKKTEAHNLIRIDGLGQHNAGASIGTDGRITGYVLSGFADYVCGDATLAYSTHSPYNNTGVPYSWSDWSWGLVGANPVEHALRGVVAVHGTGTPPYFVIRDDIKKDEALHHYDWCMHVPGTASVDTAADPLTVVNGGAQLLVYPVYPGRESLTASVSPYDNGNADPNSGMIELGTDAVDPHFTLLLLPLPATATPPEWSRDVYSGGVHLRLGWGEGVVDEIVMQMPPPQGGNASLGDPFPWAINTDAALVVVRKNGPTIAAYTLVDGTWLIVADILMAAVEDGPATLVFDGQIAQISRPDARFRVRAEAVNAVYYRDTLLPSHVEGEFRVSGDATGAGETPLTGLGLRVYPNPFNPSVHVSFVNASAGPVEATIHDVTGRTVRTLVRRVMGRGAHTVDWDGSDDHAQRVTSGVYFLRISAGGEKATRKLVLLR